MHVGMKLTLLNNFHKLDRCKPIASAVNLQLLTQATSCILLILESNLICTLMSPFLGDMSSFSLTATMLLRKSRKQIYYIYTLS